MFRPTIGIDIKMPDHNAPGGTVTTREQTLAAYDRLPAAARRALQDAAFDYDTLQIARNMAIGRKGYTTGEAIARVVSRNDKQLIERDRKRVWERG